MKKYFKAFLITILIVLPSAGFAALDLYKDSIFDNDLYWVGKVKTSLGIISLLLSPILLALYATYKENKAELKSAEKLFLQRKLNQYILDNIAQYIGIQASDLNIRIFYPIKKYKWFGQEIGLRMNTLPSYEEKTEIPDLEFAASEKEINGLVGQFFLSDKSIEIHKDLKKVKGSFTLTHDQKQHVDKIRFLFLRKWVANNKCVFIVTIDSEKHMKGRLDEEKKHNLAGITLDFCHSLEYINIKNKNRKG